MSGIVGIWNLDGRAVDRSLLASLSMTLAHRGPDGEGIQFQSSVGMACQNLQVAPESVGEIQPLVHSSGAMLVFDGRIDNREELLRNSEIAANASDKSSDAALVLAAYSIFGEKLPEHLNGDFALGLYDPDRQLLLLARDAIGIRPLYYYHANNLFIFASEIKALLAHPMVSTRPNDQALASFLLGGNGGYGGTKGTTFFEGIYSVPPAHAVIVTKNGFGIKQYWDFDPTVQVRFGSFEDYTEAFRQHFERAVQRRIRSAFPVAVSVSGGLDSSAIFCQAETLRRRNPTHLPIMQGFSYVYNEGSPADEREFLNIIEQEYRIEIKKIPVVSQVVFDGARKAVWHAEGPLLQSQQNGANKFFSLIRQTGAKTLLSGHWGDQMLFDMAYLVDLFHKGEWSRVFAHLDEYPHWLTDADPIHFKRRTFFRGLLRYHIPDAVIPLLRTLRGKVLKGKGIPAWYTENFQKLAYHSENFQTYPTIPFSSAHFKSLYREARSNYYVLCMEWNNKIGSLHELELAYPFLDRDLISFLMNIPGEIQAELGVPKALLRGSMRSVLPEAIIKRRWKADFTDQVNEGMEKDFFSIVDILQRDTQSVKYGYIKYDMIITEVSKLKKQLRDSNDATLTWSLEKLLALELWLKVFFEDSSSN